VEGWVSGSRRVGGGDSREVSDIKISVYLRVFCTYCRYHPNRPGQPPPFPREGRMEAAEKAT
jgi:hypothetical protein